MHFVGNYWLTGRYSQNMNRNPLIPTATVDKNGRQTTVHKRMDAGGPGRAMNIPQPVIQAQPADNCKLIVTAGFEADIYAVKMSDNVREKMMDTLDQFTLTRAENTLRESNTALKHFRKATYWCAQNRNFAVVNSLTLLTEESEDKSATHQERILLALMGVQHIRGPKTPEIDLTNPDDDRAEGARALVKMAVERGFPEGLISMIGPKKDQNAIVFIDQGVGNLIMDRPDRADEIVDMYQGRKPFDRGLYEAALDNNVRALNDGAL